MGITNFASYGDDTKPDCRCHFSVNKNMRVGTIETKLIHHSNLTCEQRIGKQASKNDETFFLTNHSLSFAYSPPTFQFFQISQAAAKNVSCCCTSRLVLHATS